MSASARAMTIEEQMYGYDLTVRYALVTPAARGGDIDMALIEVERAVGHDGVFLVARDPSSDVRDSCGGLRVPIALRDAATRELEARGFSISPR